MSLGHLSQFPLIFVKSLDLHTVFENDLPVESKKNPTNMLEQISFEETLGTQNKLQYRMIGSREYNILMKQGNCRSPRSYGIRTVINSTARAMIKVVSYK